MAVAEQLLSISILHKWWRMKSIPSFSVKEFIATMTATTFARLVAHLTSIIGMDG
jgi:hypothetical protein